MTTAATTRQREAICPPWCAGHDGRAYQTWDGLLGDGRLYRDHDGDWPTIKPTGGLSHS
jgi:hypothetical protein